MRLYHTLSSDFGSQTKDEWTDGHGKDVEGETNTRSSGWQNMRLILICTVGLILKGVVNFFLLFLFIIYRIGSNTVFLYACIKNYAPIPMQ